MRRSSSSLTVIVASTIVLLFAGTGSALAHAPQRGAHQDFPPRPGATPIVIGLPNLNPPTATVVPAHSNSPSKFSKPPDAVRVALSNGYVRALVSDKPYRVRSVDPWPAGPGKVVRLAFYHPVTISGTWLDTGKQPYKATYRNVQSIKVFVNTRHSLVVSTIPYPRLHS